MNRFRQAINNFRWKLASWLIGTNTRRAIYFGPDAMTITWEARDICWQTIIGAEIGICLNDGKIQTIFAATTASTKAD